MTYTTNGTHSPTPPLYTTEEIAHLTALGVMFTWGQLDPEDQLERVLSIANPLMWYQRTPDDFLSTLAFFRKIPAQWGRIWEQCAAYKGNPWKLQEAVDDLLRDEQTARAPADTPGPGPPHQGASRPSPRKRCMRSTLRRSIG